MTIHKGLFFALFLAFMLLITGCTQDTTIEVRYVSELSPGALEELRSQGAGTNVTVAQFLDNRTTIGVAGAKNPIGNVAVSYNPRTPISELVRDIIADELSKAGLKVEVMGLWDLDPERLETITTALVLGGEIKVFWAENRPQPDHIGGHGFGNVRILFAVANPKTGQTVWKGEIEGMVSQSGLFITPNLEEMLEKAFSQVLDRLLTNEQFIQAIGSAK